MHKPCRESVRHLFTLMIYLEILLRVLLSVYELRERRFFYITEVNGQKTKETHCTDKEHYIQSMEVCKLLSI